VNLTKDDIIEFLTEDHLSIFGGYPHDYDWIGDTLVVADLDDAKDRHRTMLRKWSSKAIDEWVRDANRLLKKGHYRNKRDAICDAEFDHSGNDRENKE